LDEVDTIKKRQEDATSSETLEDIEDAEVDTGDTGDEDGPSPDGALDTPQELQKADPM
jgi:hypothetical protein